MPYYVNNCKTCSHTFSQFQPITAEALKKCPKCFNHTLHRVPLSIGIVFKGDHFYCNQPKNK